MRTTLDIPDTLYRQVRSKSALEGSTLRAVTITLYTDWLSRSFTESQDIDLDRLAHALKTARLQVLL